MIKYFVVGILAVVTGVQGMSCIPSTLSESVGREEHKINKKDRLTGSLEINPEADQVQGNISYGHYLRKKEKIDGLTFYIPIDFEVLDVSGQFIKDYKVEIDTSSYIGQFLKTITIILAPSVYENALLEINFEYSGKVDLRGFAELEYPTPWIEVSPNTLIVTPIPIDFPEARYNLRIQLPNSYQVIAPGKTLMNSKEEIMVDSQDYIKGVYLIIGKDLSIDHLKYKSTRIRLVSYKVPKTMKDRLSEMAGWTIDYYNDTFGKDRMQDYVTIALRPSDEWDASFAAGSNYFVSYDSHSDFIEKEQDYYSIYAHEMAHFWWKEADALTNSNWLNEGFAEFSSMLAIKSFYGEAAFEKKIKYHQVIMEKVPTDVKLGNFERFGEHDQAMSYSVGAILLNDIYNELGEESFNEFLSEILKSNINKTEHFVDYLIQNYSGEWLDKILSKI